ncbi:hypothetical protein EXA18_06490 [Vibrio cincinnatiensis]|uniref:hypothetical protein n=1 Tax=Vibrio cincinnatiensis TaxID=675 RepID=UPI001EDE9558|nr:hypothetical protein [Vibrio cincinnatiensis]MCG3743137.1 hypothetical protein [Vibrio cincinnatiensis]
MINQQEPFLDMEPNEALRDYAIRKSHEAERSQKEVANLRDWIHEIAVNSGNEQYVIDATSSALCGDECGMFNTTLFLPLNHKG